MFYRREHTVGEHWKIFLIRDDWLMPLVPTRIAAILSMMLAYMLMLCLKRTIKMHHLKKKQVTAVSVLAMLCI